jgi:hypothetical protein
METYNGVFDTLDRVDYKKIAVKSNFVSKDMFKREDVKILHNIPVNPKNVTFPEVITTFNSNYFFSVGELNIPIKITSQERDDIHIYPSYGSGYWEMVATLVYSNRPDLIEEKKHIQDKSFYFASEDLRVKPEFRNKIYTMIKEDPKQNYYEMALKHGFDLSRLY